MKPGFRIPAEWEPQAAVWLSWPVSGKIWPGQQFAIQKAFAKLAAELSYRQPVSINADASAHDKIMATLNRAKCDITVTTLYDHPTDDVWCRDHGPVWLKNDGAGEVAITDWRFNAWGRKFEPYDQDDRVPSLMANSLGVACLRQEEILEGGAIETDGQGRLLTTEAVMLNSNRGTGLTKAYWKKRLEETLAIREVIWLPEGLTNDDTDGHIDNVARFTPAGPILTVEHEGDATLADNLRLFSSIGDVVTLPRPRYEIDGKTAPASYANYVLLNNFVLVPAFGEPRKDADALGLILDMHPGTQGKSIDCRLFIEEGGALHCLTNNQPTA